MKFRQIIILPVIAFLVTGCQQPKAWYKDGATNEDFYMDKGQCNAQAFSISGGTLLQAAIVQNSCMQGKGWSLQPVQPQSSLTPDQEKRLCTIQ